MGAVTRENPAEFCLGRVNPLSKKRKKMGAVTRENPAEFCLGRVNPLSKKRKKMGAVTRENPAEFCLERVNPLSKKPQKMNAVTRETPAQFVSKGSIFCGPYFAIAGARCDRIEQIVVKRPSFLHLISSAISSIAPTPGAIWKTRT